MYNIGDTVKYKLFDGTIRGVIINRNEKDHTYTIKGIITSYKVKEEDIISCENCN